MESVIVAFSTCRYPYIHIKSFHDILTFFGALGPWVWPLEGIPIVIFVLFLFFSVPSGDGIRDFGP